MSLSNGGLAAQEMTQEKTCNETSTERGKENGGDVVDQLTLNEKPTVEQPPIDQTPIDKSPIEKEPIERTPIEKMPIEKELTEDMPMEGKPTVDGGSVTDENEEEGKVEVTDGEDDSADRDGIEEEDSLVSEDGVESSLVEEKDSETEDGSEDSDDDSKTMPKTRGYVYLSPSKDTATPLLQQPLLVSGKRERVATTAYKAEGAKEKKVEATKWMPGRGVRLAEIPSIDQTLLKTSIESLRPLHRLLFGREGKPNERRKNIRNFNGFEFAADSETCARKKALLPRMGRDSFVFLRKLVHVKTTGKTVDEQYEEVINFLLCPVDQGHKLASSRKRSKSTGGKKKTPKKTTKKRATSSTAVVQGEEEEGDTPPPAKKAKTMSTPKSTPKSAPKTTTKSTPNPKSTPKGTPKRTPQAKLSTPLRELSELTKSVVLGSDMESTTMKEVMAKVAERYAVDHPLVHVLDNPEYKQVIKACVKKLIGG